MVIVNKTELREIQKDFTVIDQIAERRKIALFFEASRYFIGQTLDLELRNLAIF